ncbi:Zn-ribbon domain-containing OB-fold protein [Natrinema sp. 1APR25-10V2]|uniref:Zn-ribbon domain-containing OB-fold protein n=1 Tax=Natrinema sp. 1APR25-10V2 TaxID=2951081 RepID=UPI0028743D6A|nr:Zn-ribbon domain-containing OB-fold protein [Natrinema sp. 1APR25-10V2]MDS0474412.1 Zn-ribbon domain-containing OB-fold protein [Natrinema sp. 1APR25-10V2]
MSEPHRPVPDVTPETERYWEAAAEGRLLVRECQDCGLTYHYPRALCPDCFSDDVDWVEAAGTGEVYSYSVARSMSGWPDDDLPLVVAYVELDEGPRMVTNVDCDPDEVTVGSRVEVRFADVDAEDVAIPVFVLTED